MASRHIEKKNNNGGKEFSKERKKMKFIRMNDAETRRVNGGGIGGRYYDWASNRAYDRNNARTTAPFYAGLLHGIFGSLWDRFERACL